MYELIAALEDDFLPPEAYMRYAKYVANLVPAGGAGVDVGCGSGRLTEALYDAGLRVSGVDPSPGMLRRAGERAREGGRRILYVSGDAALKGHTRLDFITAATDVVNHIQSPHLFFARAFAALKTGGVLVFDISSAYKLKNTVASGTFYKETEHFARVWNTFYITGRHTIEMEVIYFQRRGEMYERRSATGMQYLHQTTALTDALTAAGFRVSCASDLDGGAVLPDSERIYFTAYKH